MAGQFLYEELNFFNRHGFLIDYPELVKTGLSGHIVLREYQDEAFRYFVTYVENETIPKKKPIHTLFHMATGSGKTVIMAGLILYFYTKGYRKFLFFVNQTNILEKTKENFLNKNSSKYLFADEIEHLGEKIKIHQAVNFSGVPQNTSDIYICFTTTQKLHMDLRDPKENSMTFEDFEKDKIVFISDESHHVNTMTKRMTKDEEKDITSWENSVLTALKQNKEHIMLEFTATCDLNDKNVKAKYLDKIVYNYPLLNFRQSGYTKDFQNFATNSTLWDRALMAMVMSEYRKYLFADAGVNIKPVALFKSQLIKESEAFYELFFEKLKNLSAEEIARLYGAELESLSEALDYFKGKDESFQLLVHSLQDSFAANKAIIMNGKQDNTTEQQLQVNSLEDRDNPIRFIFAVDMLNEGWDVLNLFDIVRLYDTRQVTKKVSPYTIKEAQLIGRGARYCPFQMDEEQERFKRKYDADLDNSYRVLETMYFHSRNDSRYISELRQALIQTGMEDEQSVKLSYELKDSFKESELYRKGFVLSNRRIKKDRSNIQELEESKKHSVHSFKIRDFQGGVFDLFGKAEKKEEGKEQTELFRFKEIPYNILSGAAESYRELRFDVIKEKFPRLKSMTEFLTSDSYLGNNLLEITYAKGKISGRDMFEGLLKAFNSIASYIVSLKPEYEGSRHFWPQLLSEVLKDKSIYVSKVDAQGGVGASQNNNPNAAYQLNLAEMDWYVYNDNYGTSEEKLFIKHFNREIKPKLEEKGLTFYLVRNERIPEFAIYSFADGARFEPDFLLFVEKRNDYQEDNFQVYIEPKGDQLLRQDQWKEDFLLEIESKHKVEKALLIGANQNYTVIGLPFFNENYKKSEFDEAVNRWISRI